MWYKITKDNRKNPEDIAPSMKYFNAPSPLLIEKVRDAINTNALNVCNSKAKYVKIRWFDNTIKEDPSQIIHSNTSWSQDSSNLILYTKK